MKRHRSLKRTPLQAEIQKNSEKQPFTHSDSKKNSKETPDLLPSANMRKRISNIHESTRRFNAASPKNAQRTLSLYDPNEPQPRQNPTLKSQSYNSSTPLFPSSPSSIRVNPQEEKGRCER